MGHKKSRKREQVREGVRAPKIKVKAMDLFRAQDHASKVAVQSRIMRTADGYENCISKLGLHEDNALAAGTYDFDLVTRNRILLEMAYRGSWVVGAVIDSVAEDMTRAGADITTSEAETELADFRAAFSRLQIWQSLSEGIRWGDLYGGSIGVMQIEGQALDTPLVPETVAKGQFKGIVVFDRWMLNPMMTPTISSGPDMGLPVFYQIVSNPQAYDPKSQTETGGTKVHHSRVFRHIGIKLPFFQAITEQMWGESVLERLWDRLIMFDNASLSTGQLIDRANLRTVKIEGLRQIAATGGDALEGLAAQFELMRRAQTNEGLTLLDKEDEFASTSYSFAGLSDTLLQLAQQLAGASGIPLVRLFGQSPAGLNATGDSDIRLYYDKINARQESVLREPFSKLLQVMWASEFGKPAPKDLEFKFTALWQMNAKEKAEIAKSTAETVIEVNQAGLLSAPSAMKELRALSATTGTFGTITDEDIAEAELEPAPLPDVAPDEAPPGDKPEQVPEGVQGKTGKTGDSAPRRWYRWW